MSDPVIGEARKHLRDEAESRLGEGTAPGLRGGPVGIDALDLLHQLASTPERAGDALRLLHELQVYQVELDLQHEQMDAERQELATELAHFIQLYEGAPVSYVLVDSLGVVTRANAAAAEMFRVSVEAFIGKPMKRWLGSAGSLALAGMLTQLAERGGQASCTVDCVPSDEGAVRSLTLWASAAPGGCGYGLVFTAPSPDRGAPPPA